MILYLYTYNFKSGKLLKYVCDFNLNWKNGFHVFAHLSAKTKALQEKKQKQDLLSRCMTK